MELSQKICPNPGEKMARKITTFTTLSSHGVIARGTEIEVVPDARPIATPGTDPRILLARIEVPEGGAE